MRVLLSAVQPGHVPDYWGSYAIQRFEGHPASHCASVMRDGTVIDATARYGVRAWTLDEWLGYQGRVLLDDLSFPAPDEDAGEAWARAQLGKRYDWLALAGFVLWRDLSSPSRGYCSRLVAGQMLAAGCRMPGRTGRTGVRLVHNIAAARSQAAALAA